MVLDRVENASNDRRISQMSSVATVCAIFTCTPRFCSPKFRAYRAATYSGLGLTGILFVTHGVVLYGWTVQRHRMALDWMALMAFLNFLGAGTYAARVCTRLSKSLTNTKFMRPFWHKG